jgi:hypothetical protein
MQKEIDTAARFKAGKDPHIVQYMYNKCTKTNVHKEGRFKV